MPTLITNRLALVAALATASVAAAAAALVLGQTRAPARPVAPPAAEVRRLLELEPVLRAEAALERRPDDPQARLALADACDSAADPVGAALALHPLLQAGRDPKLAARYVELCARIGWLEEARAALARLEAAPPAARLALAAASVQRGDAPGAVAQLRALEDDSLRSEEWLEAAAIWYQCRRPADAVRWAERGVPTEGIDPASRVVLARCLLARGATDDALAALAPAGSDPVVDYWRARAHLRSPAPSVRRAAAERLAAVAEADGGNPVAAFEAGRAFLELGDARRAVRPLSQAAVAGYQEPLAYELLARTYVRLGWKADGAWARARAHLARGEFERASPLLRESIRLNGLKPLVHIDLARALHAGGRLREAQAALERAKKVAPGSIDIHLMNAKLLLHLERPDDVERELLAAAEIDPKRANEALGNLGTVFFDSQQYDRAVPMLQQALAKEAGDAHSHLYLGRAYARRVEDAERARQAVHHLLRAALMQPDYSTPWVNAAILLQQQGHLAEAAACLRRAIGGESSADTPYPPLSQIMQKQGRSAERRLLLKLYAARRNHDLNRANLEEGVNDRPREPRLRLQLGKLLLREGRAHRAHQELLVAAARAPGSKEAHSRLADACALLGYDDMVRRAEDAAR